MKKRSQIDEQKLLEMADRFDEDEFGNLTLFFNTTVGVVRLNRCRLDGDTSVQVTVPTQIEPLVLKNKVRLPNSSSSNRSAISNNFCSSI